MYIRTTQIPAVSRTGRARDVVGMYGDVSGVGMLGIRRELRCGVSFGRTMDFDPTKGGDQRVVVDYISKPINQYGWSEVHHVHNMGHGATHIG